MVQKYTPELIAQLVLDVVRVQEPPVTTVEERIERIEQRQNVHDLLVTYCVYEDQKRWNDAASLFTENCVRVMAGTLDQVSEGRSALLEASGVPLKRSDPRWGEGAPSHLLADSPFKHLVCTEMIKLGPQNETARLVAYCDVVVTRGMGADFQRGVHEAAYYIELVHNNADGWLIDLLVILTDHAANPLFRAS